MSEINKNPWQLVKNGYYGEAIEAYTLSYEQDGRPSHLFNRGLVYLIIEKYSEALQDFEEGKRSKKSTQISDSDYIYQGVCYWYLSQPLQAIDAWHQSLQAPYTDAAGGVETPALLLYAATRLQDAALLKEASSLLLKHSRQKLDNWPGAIVPFLLGKKDVIELEMNIKEARNETLYGRWQCQADFYVALRALREGDDAIFRNRMIQCYNSSNGYLEQEYYLARWEVMNGFPKSVFGN